MILTGQLLLEGEPRSATIQPGWIQVEGDLITKVQAGALRFDADEGGPDCLIAPGFVDPHLHLPQIDSFGAYGMPLLEWLQWAVYPAETAWADADHAEKRCEGALRQLWAVGTTGIFAFTSNHRESTRRALGLCERHRMRAILGQPLSDYDIVEPLRQTTAACLDDARFLVEQFSERSAELSRVCAAVAPRFAPTATPELLAGCGEIAREHESYIATHLAENETECLRATKLHEAPDYATIYHRAGLLSPKAFHAHCIHLSQGERWLLAETGSVAVHCPTSNAFLRSGIMNRARCLRDGVLVALATDIAAGYEKSMVRTARQMLEITMYVDEAPPSAAEAWWQITTGNADLLGWSETGRIREGCEADLVIIEPPHAWLKTIEPLSELLWSWDDRWLKATFIGGCKVFQS